MSTIFQPLLVISFMSLESLSAIMILALVFSMLLWWRFRAKNNQEIKVSFYERRCKILIQRHRLNRDEEDHFQKRPTLRYNN